jgi:hypothetical protein
MMWRAHNREFINPRQFAYNGFTMMSNHAPINGSVGENHVPFSDHMRRVQPGAPKPRPAPGRPRGQSSFCPQGGIPKYYIVK